MSHKLRSAAWASLGLAAMALPAVAADTTSERLRNTANEPQNWLMVHHDYDNSRHSALTEVNRDNVKNLAPKFIFSIGGRATGGTLNGKEEATPLVEDGIRCRGAGFGRRQAERTPTFQLGPGLIGNRKRLAIYLPVWCQRQSVQDNKG